MARSKNIMFTDTMIKKLKPVDKKYIRSEGNGFTVRVMPSGVKTWLYVFSFADKRREMNLGSYPEVTLETARGQFEDARKKVRNGIDPMAEKAQAEHERSIAPSVEDLVSEYIERHAKKFKKSWEADERLLAKEVVPFWGKRKAADITKRDVTLLLENIVDRGTPAMSNQVLKITRKMFNFAIERDILQQTPFIGVKALAPNTRRERTLTETEIRAFWENIENAIISDEVKRALKLVLVTAQRPGEITGMHVREIEGPWWTIPAERAKNGKAHRVYLTDLALELVEDTKGKGYLFPCPHQDKEKPIEAHALSVAVRRNLEWPMVDKKGNALYGKDGKPATENRLEVAKFTPHDLRRTAATFMASMGYMDEIIDAVLNHVKQGIIRTYNRHGYDQEKQMALEAWAVKLATIVNGAKTKL